MNDPSQMMNRAFGIWPPPLPPAAADDPMGFQTPRPFFSAGVVANPGRVHWKVKKAAEKRKKAAAAAAVAGSGAAGSGAVAAGAGASGYRPPRLTELQFQNHVKTRRFYPKKKSARFAPYAPRNTTSFIIRAKKSGGIASLVSPCPVTPAILPTPKFSPSREGLVDMAKEEWGVDGYGSMKGLIRLRSPTGMEVAAGGGWGGEEEEEEMVVEEEEGSSDSDVEEHLEVERRLDHDLSRFEMVYPGNADDHGAAAYVMENRLDDQDTHIAHLEEENLTLKERLFLVETEMGDLRRRLQLLEREFRVRSENDNKHRNDDNCNLNANEEASENDNNSTLNAIEESSESDTMNANVEGPEHETMNTNKEGPEIDTMNINKEASENDTNNYIANNISLNVDEKALEKDGGGDTRADESIGDCEESNKIAGNYEEMNKSVGNCKESSDTPMRE